MKLKCTTTMLDVTKGGMT